MSALVDDVIRSDLPTRTLDESYEGKTEMAESVLKKLSEEMKIYGLTITRALITELQPDSKVVAAMNEINTAKRQRAAAQVGIDDMHGCHHQPALSQRLSL